MHPVELEVIRITKLKQKPEQDRADYLELQVRKLQYCPQDVWDGLSTGAKHWSNEGVHALEAGKQVPEFGNKQGKDEVKLPKKKAKPVAAEPDEKPKKKEKGVTSQTFLKTLLIEDPEMTTDAMIERAKKHGLNPTRFVVSQLRCTFKHTLRLLHDAGWLKDGKL